MNLAKAFFSKKNIVSSFTDLSALYHLEDVSVRYVMRGQQIGNPDLLIIPGSKNTIEDLIYLKNSGLSEQIIKLKRRGKRIVGICGGYQMLGNILKDPHHTESAISEMPGLGLLDIDTVFEEEKTTTQVEGKIVSGVLSNLSEKSIAGYEIHMGITTLGENAKPFVSGCIDWPCGKW